MTAREGENRIVDLGLSPSVPKLKATPDSLVFDVAVQRASVIIENIGTGVLNWTATDPSEEWLRIVPLKGQASKQAATLTVTVDRSRIEADGIYRTSVIVTSDGGTATIPIIVVVEGKADAPHLNVSPVSLAFGTTSSRRNIGITNTGSGELSWQASSPQAWIKVSPDSGTVSNGSAQVIVDIDRSQLTPGEHTGSVDLTSTGGGLSVPITVSVPTPVISLSTREIDFRADLEILTLEIANTGSGDLTWEIESTLPWLTIKPSQGVTGQVTTPVVFTVQRRGLKAGAYDVKVRLTSNSTSEPEIDIRVKMQVTKMPELEVSSDTLDFGNENRERVLKIANANNDTLIWQAVSSEPWLTISPGNGALTALSPRSISATVERRGLAAGEYLAQITVTSNGGSRTIPVKMEVSQNPILSVDKQSLDFGSDSVSQSVGIRNTGTGRMTWNVKEDAEWLEVSSTTGTTLDETDQVTFTVDRSKVLAGKYSTVVTIASDGGERQLAVEVVVTPMPMLALSADSLDFGLQSTAQTLTLANRGNTPLTWNLTEEESWIQVLPASGELEPGKETSIQVQVVRDTLPLGSYETVIDLDANGTRQSIRVKMIVPEAVLVLVPESLDFSGNLNSANIVLSNAGNIPLAWVAEEQTSWLEVVPEKGSIEPGGSQAAEVYVSRSGLTPGEYTATLTITSNAKDGATRVPVTMTVLENSAPVANAGPDQKVKVGEVVQLDGSGSSDPNGDSITYLWTSQDGISLNSTGGAHPRFTASAEGTYRFTLVVNDEKIDSAPDEVVIQVVRGNALPRADAGLDQTVMVGDVVQLDGRGSSDPDGDVLGYSWTAPSGISLSSTTNGQPSFTANATGTHRITLVVNDGRGDSAPDEVVIKVSETPPIQQTLTMALPGGAKLDLVWIEPGSFTMGSPSSEQGRENDEGPQHQVTISMGFYLGKYEITQGQWLAVMGTEPWAGHDYVQENPENPAVYISWENMQAFVHELNQAAGDSLYRLPTEAEWEYACRAGTTTAWSAGDDESQLTDYAWYWDNAWNAGEEYAHTVGTKKPNPWGLYDMHGNTWEWVQDSFGLYSSRSQTDPRGPATGSSRVGRGGGFARTAADARSANRLQDHPNNSEYIIFGGRLVRTENPMSAITPPNTPPVADAGLPQTAEVGVRVALDGRASGDADEQGLSYSWRQVGGPEVTLSNETTATPSFTPAIPGRYVFSLVVNDGQIDSVPDEVEVIVSQAEEPTGDAQVTGEVSEGGTGDAQVTGEVPPEGGTGDAQVTGEVTTEGGTGDAQVTGEVEEGGTGDAQVTGEAKE